MTQKTITEKKLQQLKVALLKQVGIEKAKARLKEKDDENRKLLLELGEPFITSESATVAPGFIIASTTEVEIDERAALAYCKREDIYPAAAGMLSVRANAVGVIIGWSMQFQQALTELASMPETEETAKLKKLFGSVNLSNIFEVNKSGYKEAVRDEVFNDIPHVSKTEKKSVRVTAGAVNVEKLAQEFEIVPDEELVEVQP